MKRTIEIDDMPGGGVSVTCHVEENGKRTSSRVMFDLILDAAHERFKPSKIHFVPIRKERTKR